MGRSVRGPRAVLLPGALVATAAWQIHIGAGALRGRASQWPGLGPARLSRAGGGLQAALIAGTLAAVAGLLVERLVHADGRPARGLAVSALTIGLAALLVTPTAWALSSVLVKGIAVLPSADLARPGPDAPMGATSSTPAGAAALIA
jgi:hypothetical protein